MPKSNSEPLVSVIMSEFDTDDCLLKQSIESILSQTYKNIELIIVDDSGHNTLRKRISEIDDKRIRILRNNTNKGLTYSLNAALKAAKGIYVARMDTDDYSYPDRLEKQLSFMLSHPKIDVIGANAFYYNEQDGVWGKTTIKEGAITRRELIAANPMIHPTIFAKKDVLLSVGGYPDFYRSEDYAMWIQLYCKNFKLYNLPDCLLNYHLSKTDYKKRSLKKRSGINKLLNSDLFLELKPTQIQIIKNKAKNYLAGIIPQTIIYKHHIKKFSKEMEIYCKKQEETLQKNIRKN